MNIFRHSYYTQHDLLDNLWKDLSNIGFNWIDDTPIDDYIFYYDTDNTYNHRLFKWGKDTKLADKHEYRYGVRFSGENTHTYFKANLGSTDKDTSAEVMAFPSDGNWYEGMVRGTIMVRPRSSSYISNSLRHLMFIPLINDGFLLYSYNSANAGSYFDTVINTLPLITWKNIAFMNSSERDSSEYPPYNDSCLTQLFCIKTNLDSYLPFTYFYYGANNSYDFTETSIDIDWGHGLTQNYTSIPGATGQSSYLNQNKNVCTLMRIPYDNKYMDNIYLCKTNPIGIMPEGKFFSFGGRNFFGCYQNVVVELPSD